MKIFPSLISADLLNLGQVVKTLNEHCDGYHIDVMDDHFVPNLTWGPAFTKAIIGATNLPIHLHLMVDNPQKWVDRIALRQEDLFVFHHEAMHNDEDCNELLKILSKKGIKSGIAINPDTPVEKVFSYLDRIDHVLLMSVHPGFSGQKFIPGVVDKVQPLIERRKTQGKSFTIGIDGGVGHSNIQMLAEAGVDEAGIASAIFYSEDFVSELKELYKKV